MPHCNATCFWWWRVYPSTVDGSLSPHKMDSNGKFNAWNYIVSVQQNKIDQRIFPTQKYLCQTDIKEKSSAKCSHMYVQHVMYVDYYLKECKSTEWKFPVLTFLTRLLSGGCGLWSWARYEFAELYCWVLSSRLSRVEATLQPRDPQRGAAPAWRRPGHAAAFIEKIKDVSDFILIIRFRQSTFRQLSIKRNRCKHVICDLDGIDAF